MNEQETRGSVGESTSSAIKDEVKHLATETRNEAKQLVREVGREVRQRGESVAQSLTESVAKQLETFAGSVRNESLDTLVGRIETTARRNPKLFLAGSVALGIALSRFLKASAARRVFEGGD